MDCFPYSKVDYQILKPQPVIGVDEVGRGCLAGPVFAGAVILNFSESFRDSKALSPKKRMEQAEKIKKHHIYSIGIATVKEIEELNIHQATFLAMKRAVEKLKLKQGHLLIDGKFCIEELSYFKQTALIKGDQRAEPIMAASIIAKVERDKLLCSYTKKYPQYQFEKHKGYGTKEHKEILKKFGITPLHRKTFSGVKELLKEKRI